MSGTCVDASAGQSVDTRGLVCLGRFQDSAINAAKSTPPTVGSQVLRLPSSAHVHVVDSVAAARDLLEQVQVAIAGRAGHRG